MSKQIDESIRTHIYKNDTQAIFHHETLAPIPKEKGGSGKTRFRVEPTIYITGVGWEQIDIMNSETKFVVGMRNYIRTIEIVLGYEHLGNSADEITQVLENLWNKKESEWNA